MVAVEEEFSASIRRSVDPPGGVSMVTLQARGQTLMLLPEKAVFLPDSDTLLVADAHIGQAPGVRHHGVPAPGGTTEASLGILTRLIRRLDARRIVFLGEFLHSALALEPSTLASVRRWRELHGAVELTLIRGNHDGQGLDPPAMLDVQVFDAPLMHRGLTLTYQPRWVEADFVIGGHLHPCVSVRGRGHDWHRLPCFLVAHNLCVLPAFGAAVGMRPVTVRAGQRVYAATSDRVFELQRRARQR